MPRPWSLFAVVALAGCTCRKDTPVTPSVDVAPETTDLAHDLELQRNVLVAFGNTTPLPVSAEFNEEVPELRPPLERATGQRPGQPLRVRVARDVPYGQLTRLMQAALAFRVVDWEVQSTDASGALQMVRVRPPGAPPRGACWARAWIGPDARTVAGIDLRNDATPSGLYGVLIPPKDDRIQGEKLVATIRRVDDLCGQGGQLRLYSQPTARVGPVFDAALAATRAAPAPKLAEVVFAVPSIGPLDSTLEVAP